MKTQRGFTLIEVMIVIVFLLVFAQLVMIGFSGLSGNSSISVGIGGVSEVRCIDGYKFIFNQDGNVRQILDEFGKGARCGK